MLVSNPSCYTGDRGHVHAKFVDDSVLIQFLQAGCERCFDVLFARYWKLVFGISWSILRRRTEAEDLVQEVFLTIYLQRDKYDSTRGSVKTWIAQFAHFKALVRRKYLQTRELTKLDELSPPEFERPESGTLQSVLERGALVEEYLSALNPRQRRTVELIHFDGYTLLETTAVLGQSLANTRNLYYRGMKALRSLGSRRRKTAHYHCSSSPGEHLQTEAGFSKQAYFQGLCVVISARESFAAEQESQE